MATERTQKGKTYTEFISEIFSFASILSPEDFSALIIACHNYAQNRQCGELGEKALVAFSFFKMKLDAEINHKKNVSEIRKASVSMRKDRINSSSDTNDITATNITKDTNVTKLQNVQFVTFVDEEKESVPSPLSPSPSSPTPLTTTPPIIPQPLKEKENPPITPKGVVRDCENAKKTDRNIAPASSLFAPRNGEHPSKSRQEFLKLSPQDQIWFEKFWTAYPKKADAPCAIRAWKKARVTDALFDRIMKSIDEHKRYCDTWERGFYKNPATWINECCWETEFGNKSGTSSPQPKKTLEQIAAEQAAYQREIELSERMAPKFI